MVDFKKRLAGKKAGKPIDPVKLYDTLDRAHDKGPLRPAQKSVLDEWFKHHKASRDVIVKLHTGQGKTLIGLLMLQSRLNDSKGPALYLCPNNFLVDQTCAQAKQFGISTCIADPDLPSAFFNSEKILVTSVQKLFNGLTRFGLNHHSIEVGTLLMDDAHACADTIREACRISISHKEPAYDILKGLFSAELEQQGVGTYADICNRKKDALLPIPYWAWLSHETEIASTLSANSDRDSIKYAWPLLKNILSHCQCVISGTSIEIEPYVAPLSAFGSYWKASHRIFMSATVIDDSFLVKGLQLKPETILNPLSFSPESWSGEKMILLPFLIHDTLDREKIVENYAKPDSKRKSGLVTLVPSFERTKDWQSYGAIIAKKETVNETIELLRNKKYDKAVVLANRYDGIDLPDDTCRILIFDGTPYSESLIDLYHEFCRQNSDATFMRLIRTIEQGMGRSVRGEKDYSVIVIIGTDVTRLLREKKSRKYLSPQMSAQVDIGLEIAEMAEQEIEDGADPFAAFSGLVQQCLNRDEDWKTFYIEQMKKVKPAGANERILRAYEAELEAELLYISGDYSGAIEKLQQLLDNNKIGRDDKAWYLQEMARYNFQYNRPESQRLQIIAHKENHLLLKPASGVTIAKLTIISQGRIERIAKWVKDSKDYAELEVRLSDILGSLTFGSKAEKMERALDELSVALGFSGERPDKEWKEGPDNLWALDDTNYIVWECKGEVSLLRTEIHKSESEQMNRSSAWFDKHYPGAQAKRILIHPSNLVPSSASFTHEVEVMRESELKRFVKTIKGFFKAFEALDFKNLSTLHIQQLLNMHKLSIPDILTGYTKKLKNITKS